MSYILCLTLVFLSGMTGLIYQVTWQSYLATFLGSHAQATSLVLGTFFLFMSLGYFLIGRWSPGWKRGLLLYGVIEGLIGAFGLISPKYFHWLAETVSTHHEHLALELLSQLSLTSLFIGLPTFLMGGSIPILTQALVRRFETSHKVHASIYSLNTIGAFLGTLLAGFILIEELGLPKTIFFASFINIFIFLASFAVDFFHSRSISPQDAQESANEESASLGKRQRWALYTISFLSGFYVFSIESLIIRIAGISIGSSTYTFSIIVASFIFAIALGSLTVSLFKKIDSFKILLLTQGLLGFSALALYLSIPTWPYLLNRIRVLIHPAMANLNFYWVLILAAFLLILLIPVGLMGMNLPLLFNFLKKKDQHLSPIVGHIYSINAVGSFLGAIGGGYALFYFLPGDGVFRLALAFIFLTFVPLALLFPRKQKAQLICGSLLLVGLLMVSLSPGWSHKSFSPGLYTTSPMATSVESYKDYVAQVRSRYKEILFSQFDASALTSVLRDQKGDLSLFINGKTDAHTRHDHRVRSLNILLPLTLAPETEKIFIIGLGTSLSTGIATSMKPVKKVRVVELSEGVIDAMPYFSHYNYDLKSRPKKYEIISGDAYKVLKSQKERYNIIVSEPSNPWVAGVEKLFTKEFLEQARARLTEQGIYTQWFPLFGIDEEIFLSILKTFQSVFPSTTVWATSSSAVLLIGSNVVLELNQAQLENRFEELSPFLKPLGFHDPTSLLGRQALAPKTVEILAEQSQRIHTLENPVLAYRAARATMTRQSVSLQETLKRRLPQPLLGIESNEKLLYDFVPQLSKTFYRDNGRIFKAFDSKSRTSQSFMYRRLMLQAHLRRQNKAGRPLKAPSGFQPYLYLMNKEPRDTVVTIDWEKNLEGLVERFAELKAMQLHADTSKLTSLLPKECFGMKCEKLKRKVFPPRR